MTIQGLSAFPITPASEDGRVNTDALQILLSRLVDAGVDSIGLLGSTGSYPYLTRGERGRAVEAAVECVRGRTTLLVGVGSLRTADAVVLARDARKAGADAGLLAPVSYAPLLDHEVFEHVRAVAEAGLPLCLYNNPGTTHFTFGTALVGQLSQLPEVVAVKNPAPPAEGAAAALADLRAHVRPGFSVGVSVDWNAPASLLAGADAWYSVLGGLYPRACLRLARAAQRGDAAEVQRLNTPLEPVWRLFRAHSSFRVVHLAASLLGIPNAVPPRPVLPLGPEAAAEVRAVFERLDLDA